ncbi:hypothetical protein [Deinococcus gobiensis]|uniref:EF-hand domain-containing protein n=1 Tax=Deinococcus gobiensis (strain DSM 21396 / JCM 16679 / CGMCC 1.7299 / I-0) TaxID=745776 RepID=H8GT90_DEIGI|nr:hypothetical protein [Deinococcus gobiensis]AFD26542.1 hypothetical protein DGo_CA2615 [Deinococcus gobiensis I-0]
MFSDQQDRHAQMARLDPRDTNGDGVVSPEEAAAYIRDYLDSASPEERSQIMKDYFGGMSPDQRQQMGTALGQSPVNAGRPLNADNDDDLVNAYTRTAQAPAQDGRSPLEAAFSQGGVLNSPLVKAGLVGLAGIIGSRMLRR